MVITAAHPKIDSPDLDGSRNTISVFPRHYSNLNIDSFHAEYEVKEELGRGLTSVVCKCVPKHRNGEEFAVKIIDLYHNSDKGIVDTVLNEVSVLSDLPNHPNIISLKQVYKSKSNVYILLELAPQGELFDYVNKHITLSEKVAASLIKQLLLGLKHLHHNRIIHRDVKMENILMNEGRVIKITDFGFAKILKNDEKLHDLCGTLSYIAPEMIKAEYGLNPAGYSFEVDMWACGVLLYTVLMGQPPFFHARNFQLMRKIQECRYDKSSENWHRLSDSARDLITRLLDVNIQTRYTAAQALDHPWILASKKFSYKKKRNSFKDIAILAYFITSLRVKVRNANSDDEIDFELAKVSPYHVKKIRLKMDDVAFTIYGHWVQREDPTSRANMFKHNKLLNKDIIQRVDSNGSTASASRLRKRNRAVTEPSELIKT